ncbi:MAG: DUF839 domain-containing protein [Moraxellaceae bacterium]|nr:DUF839 domain-containing protein [Moraxellaceae bacterium]MDZ4386258.1 DUF839 domain-containing protein [Moraxellaceae bacterium]
MHPDLIKAEQQGLTRRIFLRNLFLTAGGVAAASWLTACGSGDSISNNNGPGASQRNSPFRTMGPLMPPDANGVQLPAGFSSRVVAVVGEAPLATNPNFKWHSDPDGGGVFATDDGGWIYLSNSEARDATTAFGQIPKELSLLSTLASRDSLEVVGSLLRPITGLLPLSIPLVIPFQGGVSALRFDRDGNLVDAYPVQRNTTTNCAGGVTPWGTWINGEEIADGYMFECSPLRNGGDPIRLDRFGRKAHEMAAVDVAGRAIYHTEDLGGNERFYRTVFSAQDWPVDGKPNYANGVLQVLVVEGGIEAARQGPAAIRWINAIDDGRPQNQVYLAEATIFAGNEGVWFLNGLVYFSTKGDDNIWVIDTVGNTVESIYDPADGPVGSPVDPNEPVMFGVDNICMTLDGEMVVVEDGGDMRAMVLLPDGVTIPLLRLPGDPAQTEVTGPAFSPDGRRIYVSNQRALRNGKTAPFGAGGVVYEITMPFAVRVSAPLARAL